MSMNRKILWRNIRRLVAVIMMFVMISLQPCTVLADNGIREIETNYAERGNQIIQEGANDYSNEKFETEPLSGEKPETIYSTETEAISEEMPDTSVPIEAEGLNEAETEAQSEEMESDTVEETELSLKNTVEFEIRFIADNVLIECQKVAAGGCAHEPDIPEKPGYTFMGWNGNYTNVMNSRNVYAVYKEGEHKTHKVIFIDYNGNKVVNTQYVLDGEDGYRPVARAMEGYTFTGWDGNWLNVKKDVEIKARYREGTHKTYVLSYYSSNKTDRELLKQEWVIAGEDGTPPELEEIEGYTFAGWTGGNKYVNVKSSGNIFAMYYTGKYKTHKVEFVGYDGNLLINPQYVLDGNAANSPSKPSKDGYTFIGWDKEFYRVTAPVKIQALYREGNYITYPVSFYGKITGNANWQLLKTEYVPAGEEAHPPKLPINAGYTFREWSGKIAGITSSQKVYAQYDETMDKNTYIVRFWRKGEVIKTEEVSEGGNATAPTVADVKGYSFVGWDKSYVNITPKERGFIDITAQFRLTSSLQNSMKLDQFLVALSALKLPLIVESGFSALGYAIVIPFDGNALDIMAALGLGLIIIANWDSVKGQWENLKAIFSDFAGQDAAGEILDNIEDGVDEAGKDEGNSEAIIIGLGDIAGKYGFDDIFDENAGKCETAAKEMAEYLKSKKKNGATITLTWTPTNSDFIWSDIAGKAVGNNNMHVGVLYQGKVYCNIHPGGLPYDIWVADFVKPLGNTKLPPIIANF